MTEQRPGLEIVVGLDDSPSARAALSWAADYARAVGARLRALHVFSEQMAAMGWTPGVPGMVYLGERPSTAETTARMRVVFGQVHPDPGWALDFEDGPVGPVLVERSREATALVLGTRDHVGIERLLVGSVSHHCLSHAECPVVAVPAAPIRDRANRAGSRTRSGDARFRACGMRAVSARLRSPLDNLGGAR